MGMKPIATASLFSAFAFSFVCAAEVEWIGGSGTSWATAANWDGGAAPSASDTLLLEDEDPDGLLVLDQDRSIGGLASRNPVAGRTADYSHTIDLGGNRLAVEGPLHVQQFWSIPDAGRDSNHGDNYLTISNGTFQVGTASSLAEVILGRSWDNYYYAHLTFGDNTVFDGHLGEVLVGRGTGGWGCIDFRKVTQMRCGDEIGVFRANQVELGWEGNGARFRSDIEILFGPALASFEALDALTIAWSEQNTSWIGQHDGHGTAPFPDNADVKFGVDSSRRAAISIAQAGYWPTTGHFAAGNGGDCTAWVSTITLGTKTTGGGGTAFGGLYLENMDSIAMDVSGATQIGISADASHLGTGRMSLPPGTANFAGAVTVGSDYGWGELLLHGTAATVSGGIAIGRCGVVSNVVQGASCGLDIAAGATFTLDGTMHVVFAAPDASNGANGAYWGFRMAGDQSVALAQLMQAGKIVVDDSQIPGTANIFYDDVADTTYIAHRANGQWAPTVVTRPLSIEVDPDVSTALVIDRADIDLSPAQEGMTVTFASDYDQTPADPSIVTLPPVTLAANAEPMVFENTLTYASQDAGSTTVAADVTVIPLLPRTTSALTWAGGATLTHHYRPEWRWSANWHPATGGPAADTPAHLVFDDTSHATNRVDCDRMVGGISVRSTSGTHVFDLAGNTLAITNYAYTPTLYASEWAILATHYHAARPTDGNLNVGDKNTPSTAVILGPGTIKFAKGGMVLDNNGDSTRYTSLLVTNAVLDADFGTIRIPTSQNGAPGYAQLDLRGATVKDGVFRAENLLAGYGHYETQGRSVGHFIFDEATGITNFVVKGTFTSDFGHRVGAGRFGDPGNEWKLPPNVSFTIGESADTRGNFFVGWSNYGSDGAYLEATSGGAFSGWLDEFRVGRNSWASVKLAAMDSIELDTGVFAVAEGGNNVAELTLPPGTVRCDSFLLASGCRGNLALYGTTVQVDVSATIGPDREGTINTYVDGETCGMRFGEDVTPSFGDNGFIAIHFARAPVARPCGGVCFEGERVAEVQALLETRKIIFDGAEGVDLSKVKTYLFKGDTYVGFPYQGGTALLLK